MTYDTPSDAYLACLSRLLEAPDCLVSPRGQPCRELTDYQFTVLRPSPGPLTTASEVRDGVMVKYLEAEQRLYLSGELRAEVWAAEASKFWARLANPDGTINSNYGYLVFSCPDLPLGLTSWEWALRSLRQDRESRQAYLRVSRPCHQWEGNKDQVCTMHVNFLVRDDRLNCTTVMRSCDVVKGLAYDMPWFCYLQQRLAEELGEPVGEYTHFAHSLHLYDRDIPLAKEMLGVE